MQYLWPGEKPFDCELCANSFRQKCTWNGCNAELNSCQSRMQHMKAHHDPTPYHCDKCDRKYKLNMDLDHHKRKHQIIKTRKLYQNDTLVKFM